MGEQNQKNNSSSFDFLIVGQGISGSILALSLIESGYTVCVVDNNKLSSCSTVAAGIWNPVVFKRLVKSWKADEIIPVLLQFYKSYETIFKTKLITERFIIKPFSELQEEEFWLKKSEIENTYLEKKVYSNLNISNNQTINSYSKVLHAGNLNVVEFLTQTKKYISENNTFIDEKFMFSEFSYNNDCISYKNITAKHIVFCEGHLISHNPYFDWIPAKPAKGEVITIECKDLILESDILNKGIFILPLGNHTFKIGATYRWENLTDLPTDDGLEELESKLKLILSSPYKIIKHEAGIRPSISDRRPVVGAHPEFKNMFVFNGFGTKAVMLAPYFAKQLVDFFKNNISIDDDVNPLRFKK